MTPEEAAAQIREWVEASKKATPGPWELRVCGDYYQGGTYLYAPNAVDGFKRPLDVCRVEEDREGDGPDFRFIQASRQMPEAVVALVKGLRQALDWALDEYQCEFLSINSEKAYENGPQEFREGRDLFTATAPIVDSEDGMGREEE